LFHSSPGSINLSYYTIAWTACSGWCQIFEKGLERLTLEAFDEDYWGFCDQRVAGLIR